jgi:glycosyltransferase involved in cell wall biosynthesis
VQRVTKFVKFLPEFGWESSVLTVENPSVPLHDAGLATEVPRSTLVRRARTFEPGYAFKQSVAGGDARRQGWTGPIRQSVRNAVRTCANSVLQPDPQILWRPRAIREGLKLLNEVRHDAIIATGPPFSSLLVGATLSRRTRLPLVLDYRDEWGISNAYWENKRHGSLANRIQSRMQYSAVRAADVLLATTPSSAAHLTEVAAAARSTARSTWIYNGFDLDDFQLNAELPPQLNHENASRADRFRLAFVGTLWNLNPIGPVVQAVQRLSESAPHLAERLELVFAGRRTPDQERELDRLQSLPCRTTRLPFIEHAQAVAVMRDADALLLLNADLPNTHRIINAKTFEYIAARRPILVVAPKGDVWEVLSEIPETVLCRPADIAGITKALASALERHRCGVTCNPDGWDVSQFDRRHLAGELAVLLDELVSEEPPTAGGLAQALLQTAGVQAGQ